MRTCRFTQVFQWHGNMTLCLVHERVPSHCFTPWMQFSILSAYLLTKGIVWSKHIARKDGLIQGNVIRCILGSLSRELGVTNTSNRELLMLKIVISFFIQTVKYAFQFFNKLTSQSYLFIFMYSIVARIWVHVKTRATTVVFIIKIKIVKKNCN